MEYVVPLSNPADPDGYQDRDIALGIKGSGVPARAIEHPMREIVQAIIAGGLVPDSEDLTQLSQVLAALRSATLPVGTPMFWLGTVTPTNFLRANGAVVNRADYPDLWAYVQTSGVMTGEATWLAGATGYFSDGDGALTFRLPDFRGEFFRGADEGRGIDAGRVIGTIQLDQMQGHRHGMSGNYVVPGETTPIRNAVTPLTNSSKTDISDDILDPTDDGTNGVPRVGGETRPRNVAFPVIIKT